MHLRKRFRTIPAMAMLAVVLPAFAENQVCPAKLDPAPAGISSVPSPWKAIASKGTVWLAGVSVFDGPPEEEASLVPSKFTKKNTVMEWDLQGKYEHGKWIACEYGPGVARIAMKVDDRVTSCTATTETKGASKIFSAAFLCK